MFTQYSTCTIHEHVRYSGGYHYREETNKPNYLLFSKQIYELWSCTHVCVSRKLNMLHTLNTLHSAPMFCAVPMPMLVDVHRGYVMVGCVVCMVGCV